MDKETIRKHLGNFGDVSPELEMLFGNAYMDSGDDTGEVQPAVQSFAENEGYEIFSVGALSARAVELAPEITCLENQRLLATHIREYISSGSGISLSDLSASSKHMNTCSDPTCNGLRRIADFDNKITPEHMRFKFGAVIETWFENHEDH